MAEIDRNERGGERLGAGHAETMPAAGEQTLEQQEFKWLTVWFGIGGAAVE